MLSNLLENFKSFSTVNKKDFQKACKHFTGLVSTLKSLPYGGLILNYKALKSFTDLNNGKLPVVLYSVITECFPKICYQNFGLAINRLTFYRLVPSVIKDIKIFHYLQYCCCNINIISLIFNFFF